MPPAMLCTAEMNGYLCHGVSQVTGIVPIDELTKSKIGGIVDISSLHKPLQAQYRRDTGKVSTCQRGGLSNPTH